jgi:hypothetical protein
MHCSKHIRLAKSTAPHIDDSYRRDEVVKLNVETALVGDVRRMPAFPSRCPSFILEFP